jgi:hypothetical protein
MPGCGSGVLVSSSSLLIRSHSGCCQAKIPLSPLFKFAEPPLKLTSQDGEDIHVNLANASTIEVHKKGSRIWFLSGVKDGTVDVSETPEEILEKLAPSHEMGCVR